MSDFVTEAGKGNLAYIKSALANGADVNEKDFCDETALILASKNGHADLNARDDFDKTALMFARENGHTNIIKILKAAGAKQ